MLPTVEGISPDTLRAEQFAVQKEKFQGRGLEEYDRYFHHGKIYREPRSSAVSDFMEPLCNGNHFSLKNLFDGLHERNDTEPVHWVDMGGGRGLAMRQMAADPELRLQTMMTNVDLFEYGLEGLTPEEIEYFNNKIRGSVDDETAPFYIAADVETVQLPKSADVVTSVEVMQYLNNPLGTICNWYNQLSVDGVLLISTDHLWPEWISYQSERNSHDLTNPMEEVIDELERAGIPYAASRECDEKNGRRSTYGKEEFRTLAIKKLSGTTLMQTSEVDEVWVNPWKYKVVYYTRTDEPPIKVVANK